MAGSGEVTVSDGYGDKAGEHLRMARGRYNALPHVVLAFLGTAVLLWMIFMAAGWLVLEPPGRAPVFADRQQRDTAGLVFAVTSGIIALLLAWLSFRDRWKCVEAYASRYCSGVANLSLAYVPVIAGGYALVRAFRKLNGREQPDGEARLPAGEVAFDTTDLVDTIAQAFERAGKHQRNPPRLWLVALVGLALLVGFAAYVLLGTEDRREMSRSDTSSVGATCPDRSPYCRLALELSATDSLRQAGLSVRLEPGRIDVTPQRLDVTVSGTVTHQDRSELEILKLGVRLYDAAGVELSLVPIEVRQDFMPPLRSGDSAPFYERASVVVVPRRGEVVVLERHTVPAPAAPENEQQMALELPASASGRFALAALVRQRESRVLGSKTSTRAVVSIRNDGDGVVRKLEVSLVPRGGMGRDLGPTHPETVAYQHMPPMFPGELRVIQLDYYVMGDVAEERLVVTSVE